MGIVTHFTKSNVNELKEGRIVTQETHSEFWRIFSVSQYSSAQASGVYDLHTYGLFQSMRVEGQRTISKS